MLYREYLNSARKHQYTCEEILNCIKRITANTPKKQTQQKQLILNLFYLSGYIIECSVKYGIYHLISYDRDKPVSQLNQNDLTYDDHIKNHRFSCYTDAFNRLKSGFKLIDERKNIDRDVLHIYTMWDAETRYWYNNTDRKIIDKITLKNVETFYTLATELMKEIEGL